MTGTKKINEKWFLPLFRPMSALSKRVLSARLEVPCPVPRSCDTFPKRSCGTTIQPSSEPRGIVAPWAWPAAGAGLGRPCLLAPPFISAPARVPSGHTCKFCIFSAPNLSEQYTKDAWDSKVWKGRHSNYSLLPSSNSSVTTNFVLRRPTFAGK